MDPTTYSVQYILLLISQIQEQILQHSTLEVTLYFFLNVLSNHNIIIYNYSFGFTT